MVEDRLTDGKRIAQLLSSEIEALGGPLASLAVVDADPDATPSTAGTFAYAVAWHDERVAEVYVHPDRARLELRRGQAAAADAAKREGLRVRPKATTPPRTVVFVEDGAEVKRMLPVIDAVVAALDDDAE